MAKAARGVGKYHSRRYENTFKPGLAPHSLLA